MLTHAKPTVFKSNALKHSALLMADCLLNQKQCRHVHVVPQAGYIAWGQGTWLCHPSVLISLPYALCGHGWVGGSPPTIRRAASLKMLLWSWAS